MKKKSLFTSFALAALLGISGLAGVFSEKKVSEAKADNPLTGTVCTDFKTLYNTSTATPDSSYFKVIPDGSVPLYINGVETNLFSFNLHKSSGKISVRNYHNEGANYYFYLKYNSSKKAGDEGSYVIFEASGGYRFINLYNPYIYNGSSEIAVSYSNDGSSWTLFKHGFEGYKAYSGSFPMAVKYIKIAQLATIDNSEQCAFKDWSFDFYDSSALKMVAFDSQGGTEVEEQTVSTNGYATRPTDPTKPAVGSTGYTFNGWHTDPVNDSLFDFTTPITSDLKLYAHWTEVLITGYTLTFETFGGTAISSQTVPIDGESKFVKPDNPTKDSDDLYQYSFHKWYANAACNVEFDWDAVPTGDAIAYAGFIKQGYKPSGYTTIDPKYHASEWGSDSSFTADYGAWSLNTKTTIAPSLPEMLFEGIPNGNTHSGLKLVGTSEVRANNTKIRFTVVDKTKYFEQFRIEFYVKDYNEANKQTITLSSKNVVSDSGDSPWNSTSAAGLVLVGNCSSKPQEFTANVPYISENGTRLRYLYVKMGTYTDEEQAINFATAFNDANVCGSDDYTPVDDTKWGQQATAWSGMSDGAKAIFANYSGSNAEILECLERYDRVVYLHGSTYDFMDRITSDSIPVLSIMSLHDSLFGSETNYITIVVIIALVTSVSIIGLLAYRRKHQ